MSVMHYAICQDCKRARVVGQSVGSTIKIFKETYGFFYLHSDHDVIMVPENIIEPEDDLFPIIMQEVKDGLE